MTLTKTLIAALAVVVATSGALRASGDEKELDAATMDQITVLLTEQGYEVRKIDTEDGMIEVYAIKDGKKVELYLNDAFEIVDEKIDD